MDKIRKHKVDILVIALLLLLIFSFIIFKDSFAFLSDRGEFETFIRQFGPLAPLVIIAVIILEVVIAPIPGAIPAISAGFIFGPIEGTLYAFIGNIIGTTVAFFLARKFGRAFIMRFTSEKKLIKYEKMIGRKENLLLLLYFVPIFPTDVLSFAFGLSKIRYKKFLAFMAFGYLFYIFILTYFGDYLARLYF